jgi:hypothetical protein
MLGLAVEFSIVVAIFLVAHRRETRHRTRRKLSKQLAFEFPTEKRRRP